MTGMTRADTMAAAREALSEYDAYGMSIDAGIAAERKGD